MNTLLGLVEIERVDSGMTGEQLAAWFDVEAERAELAGAVQGWLRVIASLRQQMARYPRAFGFPTGTAGRLREAEHRLEQARAELRAFNREHPKGGAGEVAIAAAA